MENFTKFLNKYGMLVVVPLVLIMFFRTCNTNREIEKNKMASDKKIHVLDSIYTAKLNVIDNKILSDSLVRKAFADEMWDFLELEELADKKGISITELKHNRKDR
jgi:hypothetical protein